MPQNKTYRKKSIKYELSLLEDLWDWVLKYSILYSVTLTQDTCYDCASCDDCVSIETP